MMSAHFDLAFISKKPPPVNPKSLVVLLHGVGGSETNLVDLAAAMNPETLVVMPRGPIVLGAGQYGWFRVNFTPAGPVIVATEAERSRQTLLRFVQQLQSVYQIAAQKTVIAGFSQGGILSASVALSAPKLVAGFGLLSGRILPELEPHIAEKVLLENLRAFIGHGEYDDKLPVRWAQRSDQLLSDLGVAHLTRLYPMGHGISTAMQADFWSWLQSTIAGA
jgi:phospholipase/carboxylesterase